MADLIEERQRLIKKIEFDYEGQSKQVITSCNLCGAQKFIILTHRDRYGFHANAYGCMNCGLVFLNPVMTAESYINFYANIYRPLVSAYHNRLIDATTIQVEQQPYAIDCANFLAPYLSSGNFRNLLDIGGSTGVVAHHIAQRFGLNATVLDPAPLEIEKAQILGLKTIAGLLENFEPDEERFDVVLLCQTIDHLLDISSAMQKIHRLLSPDGIVFIDIVDFRAAYLRNWSVEEAIKIDHPFYLTELTMAAYLKRFGFEILRINYAADHLHIGYVCRANEATSDYLPLETDVEEIWREIRWVQNAFGRF